MEVDSHRLISRNSPLVITVYKGGEGGVLSPKFEIDPLGKIDRWVQFLGPVPWDNKRPVNAHVLCPPSYHFGIIRK